MTDRPLTHLRHVDLAVPDLAAQRAFYTDLWGLTPIADDTGVVFLAAEGSPEQYVIRLRQDTAKRVDLVAFGALDESTVDALAARLAADGVSLIGEPDKLDTPGGGYGFRFFDVDGRTVEVSAAVAPRQHRKLAEGESIPVGVSHVVLNSANPEQTVAFYERHLGFRLSDTLMHPAMGQMMWFLRCSSRHHSLAITRCPHHALHHVSFDLRGIDEFMRGSGRLLRAGVSRIWGPGRHLAGNNTFQYFHDPHGNTVEYTTELEIVDEDTWHPHLYDFTQPHVSDQWGTANPVNELVAKESFNDPDPGLFHAPPI